MAAVGVLAIAGRMAAQTPAPAQPDAAAPLFDGTRLEDVRLLINSRDWATLKSTFTTNAYYPADLRWRDQVVRNVGIRSRGNGSRSGVKPGLRVDFDRYSTQQKFLGLKSIVLRNNTQDPSHMRERLSMVFFARMGMPAPREIHARLFVNNDYAGLYTVVEAVDRAFLQRTFGEDEGYLFDYDYDPAAPPYYFEYRGANPAAYVPQPFSPETHESDPRAEVIERLIYTINTVETARFRPAIDEFLDVRGFIRYVALEAFLAELDGVLGDWGMNNYYLYRPPQHNRFTFVPWDKSHGFVGGQAASIWHNILDVPDSNRNRLMTRLLEHPDLRALFLDTIVEAARLAAEVTPPDPRSWLETEVDRLVLQIQEAVMADTSKPHTNDEFLEAIDSLRAFARERQALVTAEVARTR
jgi:spore coat protein CotH